MRKLLIILPLTLILCFMVACQDKEAMAELEAMKAQAEVEEQNKELVRKYLIDIWSEGDLDLIDEIFDKNFVGYTSGMATEDSSEDVKDMVANFRNAFPDMNVTIEDEMGEGNKVAVRWIAQATHKKEWEGLAPTKKEIKYTGIIIFRIAEGQIVEEHFEADYFGFMQQLGMELKPKEGE